MLLGVYFSIIFSLISAFRPVLVEGMGEMASISVKISLVRSSELLFYSMMVLFA